jgi:hypothetical protein
MGRARPARGLDLRPKHDPHIGSCRPRPTIRLGRARSGSCQKLCALGRPIRHNTQMYTYRLGRHRALTSGGGGEVLTVNRSGCGPD